MASKSLGTLSIDLVAKIGGFSAGMSQAEREAARRSKSIQKSISGIGSSVKAAFAVLGGAFLVKSIITATAEAERAFALLDNAVTATGGAAGYTSKQLSDMATDLQKVTTYSDEAVMGAEQLLLRFQSIQGLNFERALKSSLDLATALGKDLNSAALLVGKALENPVKGLTQLERSGVVLESSQRELIKRLAETGRGAEAQSILLDELQKRYKGAAEAARNNFSGALEGLKNAFGDLLEGKTGLTGVVDSINDLTDVLNSPEVKQGVQSLIAGILGIVGAAAQGIAGLAGFSKWIGESFAAARNGVASGDLVRMSDQIIDLEEEIKRLQGLGSIGKVLQGGSTTVEGTIKGYQNDLEILREKYDAAREAAEALARVGGTTPDGAGAPTTPTPQAPPSEEFLKMEERLKEQIALYGATGEAARLSYQIQSGALDELSKQEQQRLLSLAQQYDALGASMGDLFTRQEEIDKAIQESLLDLRTGLNESLASIGTDYDEVTEHLVAATESAVESINDSFEGVNEFQLQLARNTQDIIADTLTNGFDDGIKGVLESFADMLTQLAAQAVAADIGKWLFGDIGAGGGGGVVGGIFDKILGGIFGGGLAGGGTASAGTLYRVNENGVETLSLPGKGDYLMMGNQSGSVTPHGRSSGGSSGGVNQIINVQGRMDQRTARQLQLEAGRQQRMAMARFG